MVIVGLLVLQVLALSSVAARYTCEPPDRPRRFVARGGASRCGAVWSGTRDEQSSSFSIDVDPSSAVATLAPGHEACEGPIQTLGPIGYITLWATPVAGPGPALSVTVREAYGTHSMLAAARVPAGYLGPSAPEPALSPAVPSGTTISVCLRSDGPSRVNLIGDIPNTRSGVLTVDGQREQDVLAHFLRPQPVTLLSQLPAIFRRAALFRPSWVGPWTFWVLAVMLLGTFGVAIFAVAQAQREDVRSSERTRDQ